MRSKKEIEFLELKQGNMIVVEYAAKFEELVKFCPLYNNVSAEGSKCIKFENILRLEIKQGIGYQYISLFLMLVNKCKIYDEHSRARSAHYKSLSEKKWKKRNYGKLYSAPAGKGKHKASDKKRLSGGEAPASIKCFKCAVAGHCVNDYKSSKKRSFKCGKTGHLMADCKSSSLTCFNCGERCNISTHCQKPNKVQSGGKVFALTRSETTSTGILI
ncbi:uncharacterized protein LOC127098299 [Lathyrus oleraceus]|uniref:uncharacterized protein LOC127098299 n=1 Tax=Pisum sativum TaxID=3888 RepID=UPI0021CF2E82|nr:uncharacterized protein LOC127098299 [Pisum sativum]